MADKPESKVTQIINTSSRRFNSFISRVGGLLGVSHDGKRNSYNIYGYPDDLSSDQGFRVMFQQARREGVSNRITHGVAKTCWRDGFELLSDPKDPASAQIVDVLETLEQGGLVSKLEAADILNRIGRFSVLLIGIPDGLPLNKPLGNAPSSQLDEIYFKPFAYDGIIIHKWDTDELSPRFGLPEEYSVSRGNNTQHLDKDTAGNQSLKVHWSRIVHLNENGLVSDVEGMGALEPVFNRILDLDKTVGGSAEAYFRNARGKIAYEIDPQFAATLLNKEGGKDEFNEAAEEFTNQWKDHTIAIGAKVKTLPTAHESPLDTVKVIMWCISGYTGIPIRILTGEGAGQLAGSEDQMAYNQLIRDRQRQKCTGWAWQVLKILDQAGMIKLDPKWKLVFTQQTPSTEEQQVSMDLKKADTLVKVTAAKSSFGGEGLDVESALKVVGLGEIDFDNGALPPDDDIIQPDINKND